MEIRMKEIQSKLRQEQENRERALEDLKYNLSIKEKVGTETNKNDQ